MQKVGLQPLIPDQVWDYFCPDCPAAVAVKGCVNAASRMRTAALERHLLSSVFTETLCLYCLNTPR